jgi:hypothetical protein
MRLRAHFFQAAPTSIFSATRSQAVPAAMQESSVFDIDAGATFGVSTRLSCRPRSMEIGRETAV